MTMFEQIPKPPEDSNYMSSTAGEFLQRTSLFWLHALLSMSFFIAFFVYSLLFPSYVLAEWPLCRYIIFRWLVFCVMITWVNGRKYDNLLQFNTSWLASLRPWYYLRLGFSSSCSGYDHRLIKKSHTINYYLFLRKFLPKTKTYKFIVGNRGSSIYC